LTYRPKCDAITGRCTVDDIIQKIFYHTQSTAQGYVFGDVCDFFVCLFVYEISREPLNGFAPNSRRRRVWYLARKSLNVKVKGQRSRSPGTKNGLFGLFGGLCAVCVNYVPKSIFSL